MRKAQIVAEYLPPPQEEHVAIDLLLPYAMNARTHTDAQVAQIAAAYDKWGYTNPVLWDEKGIVAGHGRVLAARYLYNAGKTLRHPNGAEIPPGTIPAKRCDGWSEADRKAYILADNQLALRAGWNEEILKLELGELKDLGFDLHLIGFEDLELQGFLAPEPTEGETDPEETPEAPAQPVTRAGDVWVLGRHRILCGDSTVATDVERVLDGAKPHLLVSDPPYGVEYDANWRNERVRADGAPVAGRAIGKVENDSRADWREAWALFPGEVAFVWCASLHAHEVAASLHAHDFDLRSQIIWNKSNFAIGRGDYHWKHEPAWYAVKKGGKSHWQGARDQSTVWDIAKPAKSETGHSTQKPIDCMRRPIENNSAPGDSVYDPFNGSGTTLLACEMTGRIAYAIEINPAYCDVTVSRWEKFCGKAAILEGDGRTFAEVLAERCPPGQVQVKVNDAA